ncbi:UNVERIFIED_CONTAM: hypothetical protein PYX00_008919 [Menopon gallinae]|uniref:Uncharacterized protein n=1 Tax=Menopon gallinae TaxID=328185 RepID=A0AAW2H9N5_9NEOP
MALQPNGVGRGKAADLRLDGRNTEVFVQDTVGDKPRSLGKETESLGLETFQDLQVERWAGLTAKGKSHVDGFGVVCPNTPFGEPELEAIKMSL